MKLYSETLISPGLKFSLCFNNFKQRLLRMLWRKQRFLNKQSSPRYVNFLIAACWFKSYPRLLRSRCDSVPWYWRLRLIIFETLIYRLYVHLSTQQVWPYLFEQRGTASHFTGDWRLELISVQFLRLLTLFRVEVTPTNMAYISTRMPLYLKSILLSCFQAMVLSPATGKWIFSFWMNFNIGLRHSLSTFIHEVLVKRPLWSF